MIQISSTPARCSVTRSFHGRNGSLIQCAVVLQKYLVHRGAFARACRMPARARNRYEYCDRRQGSSGQLQRPVLPNAQWPLGRAAQLLIRNVMSIFLLGWAMRAPDEQRGFNVLGQCLLVMAGSLLVLLPWQHAGGCAHDRRGRGAAFLRSLARHPLPRPAVREDRCDE